jgi:hypothetical protein
MGVLVCLDAAAAQRGDWSHARNYRLADSLLGSTDTTNRIDRTEPREWE